MSNRTEKLQSRQWALKRWLEENFVPGKYWTIEEVVDGVKLPNGDPAYKLNTNPYNHDKCVLLSADVRAINWNICEGYKIILKDSKGSIKLCETNEEFDAWKQKEKDAVEKKYQYINNLVWKNDRDGVVPLVNQANNPVADYKPIDVYAK